MLDAKLNDLAQAYFGVGSQPAWIEVPESAGYTAGKLSKTSVVRFTADAPLAQADRARLLQGICDLWTAEAGCAYDEIVAVVADPPAR